MRIMPIWFTRNSRIQVQLTTCATSFRFVRCPVVIHFLGCIPPFVLYITSQRQCLLYSLALLTLLTYSLFLLALLTRSTHSTYLLTHSAYSLYLLTLLTRSAYSLYSRTRSTHSLYSLALLTRSTHLLALLTRSTYLLALLTRSRPYRLELDTSPRPAPLPRICAHAYVPSGNSSHCFPTLRCGTFS